MEFNFHCFWLFVLHKIGFPVLLKGRMKTLLEGTQEGIFITDNSLRETEGKEEENVLNLKETKKERKNIWEKVTDIEAGQRRSKGRMV